ncbi:MAG: cellulase family glycosylhydrolase [Actinomycetes bacterium]
MPSRFRLAAACAAVAVASLTPAAIATNGSANQTTVRALPALSHTGRWLTTPDGRAVVVHGFNLVAKTPPYEPGATGFGEDDAAFLQAHGFNAVRLGVIFKGLEPTPGHFDEAYVDSIGSTVQLLAAHGIYSLLDFHQDLYNERFQGEGLPDWMVQDDGLPAQPQTGFPGNYFAMPALWRTYDHLWHNAPGPRGRGLADWYAGAWAHVAAHFRGDTAVLGYDIFNEPFPGSPYLACFPPAGCPTYDAHLLRPFMAKVVTAIHRVDPRHIAFVEPWVTFDYSAPTYLGKVADDATGFSFHPYCLAALNLPVPDNGPMRTFCNKADEERGFDNAEKQLTASGQVPLVSEFGATSDTADLQEILKLSDEHRFGWLNWAYCECGDPTGAGSIESLVYDVSKPPTDDNVNQSNLKTLDVTYPMIVAGTPTSYSYDPTGGRFLLQFTTRGPSAVPQPHGLTMLHVPHPPTHVVAKGARVVSTTNGTVVLRNLPSASTVVVEVTTA